MIPLPNLLETLSFILIDSFGLSFPASFLMKMSSTMPCKGNVNWIQTLSSIHPSIHQPISSPWLVPLSFQWTANRLTWSFDQLCTHGLVTRPPGMQRRWRCPGLCVRLHIRWLSLGVSWKSLLYTSCNPRRSGTGTVCSAVIKTDNEEKNLWMFGGILSFFKVSAKLILPDENSPSNRVVFLHYSKN